MLRISIVILVVSIIMTGCVYNPVGGDPQGIYLQLINKVAGYYDHKDTDFVVAVWGDQFICPDGKVRREAVFSFKADREVSYDERIELEVFVNGVYNVQFVITNYYKGRFCYDKLETRVKRIRIDPDDYIKEVKSPTSLSGFYWPHEH